MATRPATRTVRDWHVDSRHWDRIAPRAGDVVIATAPKCGTTWTQRIVSLLIFQTTDPVSLHEVAPWVDCRFQIPIDVMVPMLEKQPHRRFMKSHLPFDAIPLHDAVRYIHVARDGRDACMSLHNHYNGFSDTALSRFDAIGLNDETIRAPFPRADADVTAFWRKWLESGPGMLGCDGFFALEKSYWSERKRENVLLVHYNDLTGRSCRRDETHRGIPEHRGGGGQLAGAGGGGDLWRHEGAGQGAAARGGKGLQGRHRHLSVSRHQ